MRQVRRRLVLHGSGGGGPFDVPALRAWDALVGTGGSRRELLRRLCSGFVFVGPRRGDGVRTVRGWQVLDGDGGDIVWRVYELRNGDVLVGAGSVHGGGMRVVRAGILFGDGGGVERGDVPDLRRGVLLEHGGEPVHVLHSRLSAFVSILS